MNYSLQFSKTFNNGTIEYSIVTPVYNQEDIIVENIKSYITHTIHNFEIIIIIDYCSDNTKQNIQKFIDNFINGSIYFIKIRVYETHEPLFETKCDNIGFKLAEGKYILEIQADMKMTQYGYNNHLCKPFKLLNNVIAVSGRCCHNLFNDIGIGKLGTLILKNIDALNIDKNIFYTYETCNRGPLLIDRKKLIEMNYLDEENYYLDNSDHDLMIRSYLLKEYICGYVPIDFYAPIENGSTRKPKDKLNQDKLNHLKNTINPNYILKYKSVWVGLIPRKYNITNIK